MAAPAIVAGLGALAPRYDVLLCDVWGVIHNGREAFGDACDALVRFRAGHGPVVLVSNSPRPGPALIEQLDALRVPREAWTAVTTSGDATRVLLAERAPGPAWRLGPERDRALYAGLGLEFAPLEEARFIACTGPFDDEVDTPADYRARLEVAVGRGLEMVCANPDIVVQRGTKLIYCGGALAQLYEDLGGAVRMAGKPHAPIYRLALDEAGRQLGRDPARDRVLCVGDGLATDIRGANAQALDALFITGGIHGGEAAQGGAPDPAAVARLLAREGLSAEWVAGRLAW